MPVVGPSDPVGPYRRVQRNADRELQRILERTARDIRARINSLGTGIGAQVRKSQLNLVLAEIRKVQQTMWADSITGAVQRGRQAAANAAEDAVETLNRVLYSALPEEVAAALSDGLGLTARAGIESDMARVPRQLSTRVFRNSALANGFVENAIRSGIISGLSARELAATVYKYISPTVPGGQSYAAMRLARTEINNAFHEQQIAAADRPGVLGVKWNLSGSHPRPDICNEYASRDSFGQGKGVFPKDGVPGKPHPQCFCYLSYVTMTPKQFANAMSRGDFDDEIDRRTKANLRRLGFIV